MSIPIPILLAALALTPGGSADPGEPLARLARALRGATASDPVEQDRAVRDGIAAIDRLTLEFPDYPERERSRVVRRLSKVLRTWFDEPARPLARAAAAGLSEMGPAARKELLRALSADAVERDPETLALVLEAIGKHRDPRDVDLLLRRLREKDGRVVASACLALAEFFDADEKTRKRIFRSALAEYARAEKEAREAKSPDDPDRRRFLEIEVAMNRLLDRMSGAGLETVEEWKEFWEDWRRDGKD